MVAWLVAALMLGAGLLLERNDQRFAHRGLAYVLFVLGIFGAPLLALTVSAQAPQHIWWLGLIVVTALLAAGRALMSCFEIVLSRGLAWRWPAALYRELLYGNAKASAALRLLIFVFEAAIIAGCLAIVMFAA
jgi:hypothetical protein